MGNRIILAFVGCAGLALLVVLYLSLEATKAQTPPTISGVDFLGYSEALDKRSYEGADVGGLSGLAYDPSRDLYYSLADKGEGDTPARFYTLRLPLDQTGPGDPSIEDATILRDPEGRPFTGNKFDGEGIAISSEDELLVASETEPSIKRFSPNGGFLAELPVPRKFLVEPEGEAQRNGTFESLALSPDGHSMFTANQEPLASDGRQSTEEPQRLRLLRYEDQGSTDFEPSQEFFYLTEPGQGVTDIAALSEDELLILEGGARVFRVSLDEAEDVSNEESLAASGLVPLEKELLVALANCPLPSSVRGSLRGLESLSLGPDLPGGQRALILQSDDNFSSSQKTLMLALGTQLRHSSPLTGEGACRQR